MRASDPVTLCMIQMLIRMCGVGGNMGLLFLPVVMWVQCLECLVFQERHLWEKLCAIIPIFKQYFCFFSSLWVVLSACWLLCSIDRRSTINKKFHLQVSWAPVSLSASYLLLCNLTLLCLSFRRRQPSKRFFPRRDYLQSGVSLTVSTSHC